MKLRDSRFSTVRAGMWALAAAVISSLALIGSAHAEERQYLVILATSAKEFPPAGIQGGQLPNPEMVRRQYFDRIDPNIGSFAEYWEEISYGDVTIRGQVTDWIVLPWAIQPQEAGYQDLNQVEDDFTSYDYGAGEDFRTDRAMVIVDITGDPLSRDDGPDDVDDNPSYARGGNDSTDASVDVWMPGERFVDFDGDGRWDGLDEASNQMDWNGDSRPDLRGPWVDLNRNGLADNAADCVYLPDSDNDGVPDCCPGGPDSTAGCNSFPASGACPASRWEGPTGEILDCNGNLIPDSCDLSPPGVPSQDCRATGWLNIMGDLTCRVRQDGTSLCGASEGHDELPMTPTDNNGTCVMEPSDGDDIPDECQFARYAPSLECVDTQITDSEDSCFGSTVCEDIEIRETDDSARCEYDDVNGNERLDIVEPFENFLRRWDGGADEWVEVSEAYITANYAGDASRVINRGKVRPLYAEGLIVGSACVCSTSCITEADCPGTQACNRIARKCECLSPTPFGFETACIVGFHAEYDPPDEWKEQDEEFGSNKMQDDGLVRNSQGEVVFTFEPDWYAQAWTDRYGTAAPPWTEAVPRYQPVDQTSRRTFRASHGGVNGDGTGWVGCAEDVDGGIVFEAGVGDPTDFEESCDRQILPEEERGIGERLHIYDGPVEHDDLPSSKYHVGGDQRLGEVTSPFNENIWGHDRGNHNSVGSNQEPDRIIPPAGPYAKNVHGNLGRDAGNVLQMEVLSWRREEPFNTGEAWEQWYGNHPYAELLGFRDYNLDGLIDQGEVRVAGTENYLQQPNGRRHGTSTNYPWNRFRMLEDCIGILDDLLDFDDFVDTATRDHLLCGAEPPALHIHKQYWGGEEDEQYVVPAGVLSGIVLLPSGSHTPDDFVGAGSYYPIHNEDGLEDSRFRDANFPRTPRVPAVAPDNFQPRMSWNIVFNDLVKAIGVESSSGTIPTGGFETAYSAHEYLHTWERFPDLYDYDIWEPNTIENCPVGRWDIMANGGLVHPAPILKEKPCTGWITSVDLATVLTPGVDTILTLPPAEFQRDKSYYFLENDNRRGERYYFWSAGRGFDRGMPGPGMLIMHTDVTPACETTADCPDGIECVGGFCDGAVSNPDAPPPQQRNTTRPTYLIVQADGDGELQTCESRGDAGDPWPGSTGATRFNFDTNPRATWYTQNSWTGLDIQEILTDGAGSARIKINWVPTSIPSLRFLDPPGGESVGSTYQVRFQATDVYGGTTIEIYYTEDRKTCGSGSTECDGHADCPAGELCTHDLTIAPGGANRVGSMRKSTPGTNALSMNWNISTVSDGRYVVFAKLRPGAGADNSVEASNTTPHRGRNNKGNGSLAVIDVAIAGNIARSETWTAVCIDADAGVWRVNSSLSQPVLNEDDPNADPYTRATTGVLYESAGGEVDFQISSGSESFELGDTFAFTTTGITAPSGGVTIRERRITLDPVAIIFASPLSGPPPLAVTFDARDSFDPNGAPISYRWDFGDASATASGPVVEHTYTDAGAFTTVLTVTNPQNARFNETAVDIEVTNNSPNAVVSATPTSGTAPLTVQFNAGQSSDTETAAADLIYLWDFGDGETANDARIPGSSFLSISHFYRDQNGVDCDHDNPCTFTATLTVVDGGGKQDTDTVKILVGNNDPVPVVSFTSLRLTVNNLEVVFNAKSSFDPDSEDTDLLMVTWIWGDASVPAEETFPLTGVPGATDGSVPHTYVLPAGQTTGSFRTTAIVRDGRGGEGVWAGVTVTVNEAAVGASSPRAIFTIDPPSPTLDEEFTVDGSLSFDRPVGSPIASYSWDFGDNSATASGVTATHTYTQAGSYTVALTVADGETPPNTDTSRQTVIIAGEGGGGEPLPDNAPPIAAFTVNPPSGVAGTTAFVFNASGSTDPDGDNSQLTFRWSFGDGTNATGATPPPHVYAVANPSGYPVRLTVRDEGNASTTVTTEVIVEGSAGNVAPVAHIATGPRTGTAPLSLTFDGRNSYDPNGDALEHRWEFFDAAGDLIDTLTGDTVTRLFSTVGVFSVELEVRDGRGESDRAGPQTVLVTERGQAPPIDDEPGQDVPNGDDTGDDGDSADQRPRRLCAFGALPGMFASLLGLMALTAARWRRRS